ncbi:MAG: zinc-ribbon domain-containing protein, partial [Clostridia bacterium]|nr:zinc-ribbon domain-containing protein [Clostridia bacterium]
MTFYVLFGIINTETRKEVFIISIVDTHPEIAKEFDLEKNNGLKPENCSKGQRKKVWWKCKNGHSYKASIDNRCY